MTKEEKLIVSAYTGTLMTDWDSFHEYSEKLLGRPIYSHEFAYQNVMDDIREKSKNDFLRLCKE